MTKEALKQLLTEIIPGATLDESGEWLTMSITATGWAATAGQLRNNPALNFDYLFCLTCVDWKTHLTMVYHFTSTGHRQPLVVKIQVDRLQPVINSVAAIWLTANFHEREVYELFGVQFTGHPDLRLLILPDGWEGKNPLRKDFEDPVNMIKL